MARLKLEFWDTPIILQGAHTESMPGGPQVRTGILNVFEAVHQLLLRGRKALAHETLTTLMRGAEPLSEGRIWQASQLRVRERHRNLSYADAAGYVTAVELGAIYVTTDRGFEGLPATKIIPRKS